MQGRGGEDRVGELPKAFMLLPYMKGVTERLQRAYQQHNIRLFCKARYTIQNAVVCLKDPLGPEEKCVVIYECKCDDCGQLYVGRWGDH